MIFYALFSSFSIRDATDGDAVMESILMKNLLFSQIITPVPFMDDDAFPEGSGSLSDRKTSISTNGLEVLSVNQLIESVCTASMPHFGGLFGSRCKDKCW